MDSLVGITINDWWKLLKQNGFAIDPFFWPKAMFVTYLSIKNAIKRNKELRIYNEELKQVKIEKDPIFILGHWRSGTTLLQNLMILDRQFAYPRVFQCNYPHTFLQVEPKIIKFYGGHQAQARPMDNVITSPFSPGEEEFALAILTLYSPLFAWLFPRNEEFYNQYLTFKGVSDDKIEDWKSSFLAYLKKLTWRYQRQLLLKSPPNTARIRLLLELFPNAKFIHIHRNPYTVFQSTKRLYEKAVSGALLQRFPSRNLAPGIIKRYQLMYDAYFEERELIPKDNFIEIKFEELEKNQIEEVGKIYHHLGLKNFYDVRPDLEKYVASISDYKKNKHEELDDNIRALIAAVWNKSFQEWGYAIQSS